MKKLLTLITFGFLLSLNVNAANEGSGPINFAENFEKRFKVNVLGAFTVNTDVLPGAEQLSEIREIIEHEKVTCVFSEPQFNPNIINAVAKDTNIKTGVLDPLGATLNPGKGLYFDLISNMAKSFKGC